MQLSEEEMSLHDVPVPSWKVGRLNDPASSMGTDPRMNSGIAPLLRRRRRIGAADLPAACPRCVGPPSQLPRTWRYFRLTP